MIATRFNWSEQLLAPLDPGQISSMVSDSNPDWEYIDGEMIKFGSLTHSSLDIEAIQSRILTLLSATTKDLRLVVHLLRTLQHAGNAEEITLGAQLFSLFCRQFWLDCYPDNIRLKVRLTQQVLQRFELAQDNFTRQATAAQRDNVLGDFAGLAQFWSENHQVLSQKLDDLSRGYRRIENSAPDTVTASVRPAADTTTTTAPADPAPRSLPAAETGTDGGFPVADLDSGNDRTRKSALLNAADALCRSAPENAIGYQLRRYAVWHTIQSVPSADATGKTPLAAVAADRVTAYRKQLTQADPVLLADIEQSLSLAPYWLDGHYLAAQAAQQLGLDTVAQAIRRCVSEFVARLPQLTTLSFSDKTPYAGADTLAWLTAADSAGTTGVSSAGADTDEITRCYQENGLDAALQKIDTAINRAEQLRDRVCLQLLAASLFEQSGMTGLAQAQYQQLHDIVSRSTVTQWEPALLQQLTGKLPESDFRRNNV
ncbi:type VI secretion system protein TssA [Morganella morganii]|nr:type VI secretion system protein TssA [Morganella morganii]